jgi:hypothetical protein
MNKLNVKAFALSCAIFMGVGFFGITWWIIFTDGSREAFDFIGNVYLGYSFTPLGSLVGFVWGFVDGLVLGTIFSWMYNWFLSRNHGAKHS